MQGIHTRVLSVVLLSLATGFSFGCTQHPNDDAVAADIQTKVAANPETKNADVKVVAKNGKVTLSGNVESTAEQQKVEQIAHDAKGTKAVEDQTVVQPPPQPIVVPTGTVLVVTLGQPLGSKTSQTGQTFLASLAQAVTVDSRTAMPKGSTVNGTVVVAKAKGKIKGEGQLVLTLRTVTVQGQTYQIRTERLDSTVKGKGKRTAVTTGGGAAGGALIGGLAGGGKGAGIGALLGGAAGFAGGAVTGNKQIELAAESTLSFTLSAPLTLPPTSK